MAGFLPKQISEFHKIPNTNVAIISSMWHSECVNSMVDKAIEILQKVDVNINDISTHKIPGSLELPFAARILFEKYPNLDAILAFGVVLKGATTHDDTVIESVVNGFQLVSDRFGKPIINEVIGVNTIEDAIKRSGDSDWNKGIEAVFALTEILNWKNNLTA
jgi:6,7-dimethyl-8-ribityllumazine synthase